MTRDDLVLQLGDRYPGMSLCAVLARRYLLQRYDKLVGLGQPPSDNYLDLFEQELKNFQAGQPIKY